LILSRLLYVCSMWNPWLCYLKCNFVTVRLKFHTIPLGILCLNKYLSGAKHSSKMKLLNASECEMTVVFKCLSQGYYSWS
uniref:Uncharacterized protein n=1 Tax=Scleropages formosus TaxID=113540 RepID=A0A8C9QUR6_SCLFO